MLSDSVSQQQLLNAGEIEPVMVPPLHVHQSLPICCSLAALGGILEVAATAVTAVPAVREKQGIEMKWWVQWVAIAGNLALQAIGTLLSHLVATWFGPVSLVVPFFYSATLLSNMLIFGVLGERFTKNMRVGTHVIVVAVVLLMVVGPDVQEDQDFDLLFRHWYSIIWFTILLLGSAITGVLIMLDVSKYSMSSRVIILLIARAASVSVNLTVSRAFILGPNNTILLFFVVIKLVTGVIYTFSIVVQSYTVEQARFVPLNATTIIVVNAITGVVIWEDWKVVSSWFGYSCIFVLLGLGCDLLLSVPLLNSDNPEFGAKKGAKLIWKRSPIVTKLEQMEHDSIKYSKISSNREVEPLLRSASEEEDWKELVSPIVSMQENQGDTCVFKAGAESVADEPENVTLTSKYNVAQKVRDTTATILFKTPNKVGKKVVSASFKEGSKGKETVASIPESRGRRLSRLAAWRETISPIKIRRNLKYSIPEMEGEV